MINIAIVEDDVQYRGTLKAYIEQYKQDYDEPFGVTMFSDGEAIVAEYKADFDIIFMDIQMKLMDGMEAAKRIRAVDGDVVIVFITNSAQYALQGYEVEALNYVLKPINGFAFEQELKKAVRKVNEKRNVPTIVVPMKNGMLRLDISHILYVESLKNEVVYHTSHHTYATRDSLKNVEDKLADGPFFRCNSGLLVNLSQVQQVDGNTVLVGGTPLPISRPRKKSFLAALATYIGGK